MRTRSASKVDAPKKLHVDAEADIRAVAAAPSVLGLSNASLKPPPIERAPVQAGSNPAAPR